MAYLGNWKYKDLKYKKVKQFACSCKNCDYFSEEFKGNGTCLLDDTSVNKMYDTCNCFAHEEFKIGEKVQVPYKGHIVDTEIVGIEKAGNQTVYITTVGNNGIIKMKFFSKEIKRK